MTQTIRLRPNVVAAKARLAEGREKLRQRHDKGSPGIQVCGALADLIDTLVTELYEAALVDLKEDGPAGLNAQVALVPHGGYGRRDVAPYSDVDLMLLHSPEASNRVVPLAERMIRDLFDAGMTLGQSVRTPAQACQLARKDGTIFTSLVESRLLAGSATLFERFTERFRQQARRHSRSLIGAITEARGQERAQFGETVYLLEPNVKRSRGGLRDIQLLRWVGFARHSTAEPDGLKLCGALSRDDYEAVRRAWEFLLRLRNELHFHAGKSSDVLDRVEQLRLAEWFGFEGEEGLLPVEQFMREYFRLTDAVSHIATRFVANARRGPRWEELLSPLLSHQFEGDFLVGPIHISANRRGLEKLQGSLAEVLRLADLANLYNKPISHTTTEVIRAAVPQMPDQVTLDVASRFLSLLSQPARLGELLRGLYEMGVLEKIIPAFSHARSLLQFNEYHKFTVDEHCLRAVEQATSFLDDPGPLGEAYRNTKRKWMLHLALLIHDLGKGFSEDHSEVGRRIAGETAERLGLSSSDAEALKFLVHKHLMMSHLAFRRDTSDNQLVVRFAVDCGSPELLQMLFVLTGADLGAVGPGVLNAWKVEVLAQLYERALSHLAGDTPGRIGRAGLETRRAAVLAVVSDSSLRPWYEKQLQALPAHYLYATPPQQVAADLCQLQQLASGTAMAVGRYQPESHTTEYKVGTYEDITPGVFHKLTGALASKGLQILSAEIHTLADGLVFDRFFVHDPDYADRPPQDRLDDVCRALVASLRETTGAAPVFRRVWRAGADRRQSSITPPPTVVRADNSTSDRFTILDVFAADQMGLLYTIARAIFESGLSVSVAKIGTYLDQVVDVFYVTDQAGKKIEDEGQLRAIRERLLTEIEELERRKG